MAYSYSAAVTIKAAQVPNTDQTNFPLLFAGWYPYLATVANGGQVQNANGYDIIFTSDSGGTSPLSWEIDKYSADGTVAFWIKIPTLSHTTNTVIYMFWGNASISTFQSTASATWDTTFEAVYHFGDGATLSLSDSTSNGNTLTNSNVTAGAPWMNGGGASFNGSSAKLTASGSSLNSWTDQTISFWMRANTGMAQFARIIEKGSNNEWALIFNNAANSNLVAGQLGSSTAVVTSVTHLADSTAGVGWYKIDVTITNAGVMTLYVNGASNASATGTNTATRTNSLTIGNYGGGGSFWFSGLLDELRIANVAKSADWILASFRNQFQPNDFYSVQASGGGSSVSNYGWVA